MKHSTFRLLICLSLALSVSFARNKTKPTPPKDSFDVVGHIALNGPPVSRLVNAKHYSSNYLYAENIAGNISIIDVTNSARPQLINGAGGQGSLVTATGDAALVSSEARTVAPTPPQTISIIDFSDRANPRVTRQFAGVTSVGSDDQRGLVFLVNPEGLWILHRNQATDPEVEARYAHEVIYNH